jgi:hypothetical protein
MADQIALRLCLLIRGKSAGDGWSLDTSPTFGLSDKRGRPGRLRVYCLPVGAQCELPAGWQWQSRQNAKFYTALVLVAVITSQFAGAWLEYVLHRGWPLLSTDKTESQVAELGDEELAA